MRGDHFGHGASASAPPAGTGTSALLSRTATVELACRRAPELFFAEKPEDVRRAQTLCHRCPVRAACLAGALERGEPWGVWGGELFLRGAIIADKRPRGRPRKVDVPV